MLKLKSYDEEYDIKFQLTNYASNNSLAILMMCFDKEYKYWEPYGYLTVNLEEFSDGLPEDCAYVDTNNLEGIGDWIVENKLGEPTGMVGYSGYCSYPMFQFDLAKIKENLM